MKSLRLIGIFALWILSVMAFGQAEWLGIYLQGQKVGFSYSESKVVEYEGRSVDYTESKMNLGLDMLGSAMKITANSATWMEKGLPLKMIYRTESAGRVMAVTALFGKSEIVASMVTESGETEKRIAIPAGRQIFMDPMEVVELGKLPPVGQSVPALAFSPESLELIEVTVEVKEPVKLKTDVGEVMASVIYVSDPRAPTTIYLTAKGDLIKIVGPMGLEMIPESEAVAKEFSGAGRVDLASASRLVPDRPVLWGATKVELMMSGIDMSKVPNDARQVIRKAEGGWLVTLGIDQAANGSALISGLAKQQPEWVKADVRVPADSAAFKKLASEIIGEEKRVAEAAKKIHGFVFRTMGVNAGIGVMRDAAEILETKEGVCRDHAILAGTILRAAGIPTRFANGLVLYSGAYYYHAWVEYWDGSNWIGMDTTRPDLQLGSGYIKTSQGTVGQALQGFLLDGAKIVVVAG